MKYEVRETSWCPDDKPNVKYAIIEIWEVHDNGREFKILSFGVKKARAVLACFSSIREFVEKTNGK